MNHSATQLHIHKRQDLHLVTSRAEAEKNDRFPIPVQLYPSIINTCSLSDDPLAEFPTVTALIHNTRQIFRNGMQELI